MSDASVPESHDSRAARDIQFLARFGSVNLENSYPFPDFDQSTWSEVTTAVDVTQDWTVKVDIVLPGGEEITVQATENRLWRATRTVRSIVSRIVTDYQIPDE